ncbi:hypothetical protein CHD2B1_029 [Escherichia phage vB_EcoS-CHD2B1]|nr:hypothetical protein CHD2B1_029 [Escherichia phage vB_EcoS-CHD2B1]
MAAGTLSVTNNSTAVTGDGTTLTALKAGDFLSLVVGQVPYTIAIASIESDTALTLALPFDGPTATGLAWDSVARDTMSLATMGVTVQAQKALRLMIADENNWRAIFGDAEEVTVTLPNGQVMQGMSWGYLSSLLKEVDPVEMRDLQQQAAASEAAALVSRNEAEGFKNDANAIKTQTDQIKTDTQAIHDATNTIKTQTDQIKTDTQSIKDQTDQIKTDTGVIRDEANTAKTDAQAASTAAQGFRDQAEEWAQSVNADNLLTKSGNLAGVADVQTSRTNLELGEGNEPIFKGALAVKSAPDTVSAQGGMFQSKLKNSNGEDVVTTQSYAETQLGTGKHTIGVITPSGSHYYQLDVEGNFNGFKRLSSAQGGELLLNGVDSNTVQLLSLNPPKPNDYTGFTRYNWQNSAVFTGPIRQGGTGLEAYEVYVLNAGVAEWRYRFRPDGKMSARRLIAEGFQTGWDQPNNYGDSGVWLSDVGNNDGGWVPAISWRSQSTGGYPIRATWGLISQGTANWPRAALRCRGDGENWTNFEFVVNSCDIQVSGTFGAYTFSKAPTSDRDLKHDIKYTEGKESYDRVMQWLPTMFKYKGSEIQRYGLIAQDLVKIDPQYVKIIPGALKNPDLVGTEGFKAEDGDYYDDTLALDSNVMLTDMACAMVFMGRKVEDMQKELEELKAAVAALTKA